MSRLIALACTALLLAGCGGTLRLLDGQTAHAGKFDALNKTMEVTVDGEAYSGRYVTNSSAGYGTGVVAGQVVSVNTFNAGNQGRATLTGPSGKYMTCEFSYQDMSAQGTCVRSDGKRYAMTTE